VLVDDPQTDASAKSHEQNVNRLKVLTKAILGLAGPGKKIAGAMPCTVIEPGDFIDQILDRSKYPQWQGQRTKMVVRWSESKLWETYAEIWKRSIDEGRGIDDATQYYFDNLETMCDGETSWSERYNPDELDSYQHAYNLLLERGRKAFFSEYQNDPQIDDIQTGGAKFDLYSRGGAESELAGVVPEWAVKQTAFIDVQGEALFWMVAGWSQDFRGHVIDYGIWPKQRGGLCLLANLTDKLSDSMEGGGLEAKLKNGIENCAGYLLEKYNLDALGIDANWGMSTDTVYAVAQNMARQRVYACHGKFYSASAVPLNGGKQRVGVQRGHYWQKVIEGAKTRIIFDSNAWKSLIIARLQTAVGDPGALTVFSGFDHWLLNDHFHAEYAVEVFARGIRKDEWKQKPGADNHWFDCIVGAAALASYSGCNVPSWGDGSRVRRVSFAERQAAQQQKG